MKRPGASDGADSSEDPGTAGNNQNPDDGAATTVILLPAPPW